MLLLSLLAACTKSSDNTVTKKTPAKISTDKITVSVTEAGTLPHSILIQEGDSVLIGTSDTLFYHNYTYSWYPHVGASVYVDVSYSISYVIGPTVTVTDGTQNIAVRDSSSTLSSPAGNFVLCQFKAQ